MASLGKDLAYIRKERNISLDDIYEATKIPKRILHSIEDDSIFTDFEENPTYIRSYIRSYAKVLSIDEKEVIYALNKQEKKDYSGSLQSLLENKPVESQKEDNEEKEEDEAEPELDTQKEDSESSEKSTEAKSEFDQKIEFSSEESNSDRKKPSVRSVDWADMGRQFQPLKTAKSRTWVGIFAILLLLAGSGAIYYFYLYDSGSTDIGNYQNSSDQQEAPKTVSTDSLELDIVSPEENDTSELATNTGSSNLQNRTLESLPDTLTLVLYAAYGKLEPVRVYTDIMDNINPYWIEQGEALRFNFVNDIHIRGQYRRMVLLLNGHLIQNFREEFYNPETRLIEVNRTYFEGNSKWLQPAPDSLAINAPSPNIIKERPTFN